MRRFVRVAIVLSISAAGSGTWPASADPTPPPTPVPPYGSPSPFPSTLETPERSDRPPILAAASAVLADLDTGEVLFERNGRSRRPIASTTKIMTALLVLESATPFDEVITSETAAGQEGAELGLVPGERIPVRSLLFALMLQSANDAAVALAEHVSGSVGAFVERMNQRAEELGLRNTRFSSPNGLDDSGYSTARDLAKVTVEAFQSPTFARVVGSKFRTIPASKGPARRIQNRNALLWLYPGALGGKTGYTAAAGFCVAAAAERDGLRLLTVVLGSPEEPFSDAAALLNHGFAAYERRTVVRPGERLDPVAVGERLVPVAAGDRLDVRVRREDDVDLTVRPARTLALPISKGQLVGQLVVRSGEEQLGAVPIIAREAVVATEPRRLPWWRRAWERITAFVLDALGPVVEEGGL